MRSRKRRRRRRRLETSLLPAATAFWQWISSDFGPKDVQESVEMDGFVLDFHRRATRRLGLCRVLSWFFLARRTRSRPKRCL